LAPRKRSAIWYALLVGVFIAAGLGVASRKRAEKLKAIALAHVDQWALTVFHPAGLAFDGKDVWVIDWFTQSLYAHSREDAHIVAVRHLTSETPVAAAYAADAVWTISADGTIVRRMRDDKLTPLQSYPKTAFSAAGLAFDGLYLWTLDAQHKKLTKSLLDDRLSPLASWSLPGLKPVALIWDGQSLWTLDAGDRVLRRHDLEKPEFILAVVPLPEYGDGVYTPTGLAWDGEHFWTVAEKRDGKGPARLIRHVVSGGTK
jgi:hypothetical protein